jgi:hypothetical protein
MIATIVAVRTMMSTGEAAIEVNVVVVANRK